MNVLSRDDVYHVQYAWPNDLEQMAENPEDAELLVEAFMGDPRWSSRGVPRIQKPDAVEICRIEIHLNTKEAPKATENFRCLCTGEKGKGKSSGKLLYYKGTRFHRIVSDFCLQGGDIVKGDGSGGDSIYSGPFKDEKPGLKLKHDAVGTVSMANSGPNTNKSQFFFTLRPASQCDGKHVVVGRVANAKGVAFLEKINQVAASADGTPRADVILQDCGEL